ncbi:MAG TPA: helix-turn-helix domain-containing protein [Pseudonocardiaceae bacterium]|nr:helix-turn-helix domain-containing protein [Pseudonocardiaceae bacterium]
MARPRSISDEQLLAAVSAVISRRGPDFTVADVAEQAGVAVGTVAHRFGSRAGLLHAFITAGTGSVVHRLRAAGARGRPPVATLADALAGWFADLGDPATVANHLAQLGTELADPRTRELLAAHFAAVRAEVRGLLLAAAADLPGAPPAERAAGLLVALVNGVAMDWAIRPVGSLVDRVRGDVDAVLAGWTERRNR